jgi:hypothetical protein
LHKVALVIYSKLEGAGNSAMHALFNEVRSLVRGVCHYCAKSYGVQGAIEHAGLPLLGDDRGHASLRALLVEGRQIVTV